MLELDLFHILVEKHNLNAFAFTLFLDVVAYFIDDYFESAKYNAPYNKHLESPDNSFIETSFE